MSELQALKALLVAVDANPRKAVLDTVSVVGNTVEWDETCRRSLSTDPVSGGCLHHRSSIAPREAVDALMEAVNAS